MTTRKATALWNGTLKEGNGTMAFGSFKGPYTYASRFETGEGTNPEELVGAAHAGCYSMFLSALLGKEEGVTPKSVNTTAAVELGQDNGPKITSIVLTCEAEASGISEDKFQELVAAAKAKCPISRLFAGTDITVNATLKG